MFFLFIKLKIKNALLIRLFKAKQTEYKSPLWCKNVVSSLVFYCRYWVLALRWQNVPWTVFVCLYILSATFVFVRFTSNLLKCLCKKCYVSLCLTFRWAIFIKTKKTTLNQCIFHIKNENHKKRRKLTSTKPN